MHERGWLNRSVVVLAVALLVTIVGFAAFNAGVSHGLALSGRITPGPYGPYPYGWYRPWGFGFGPLLFLVLFFFIARGFLWGGPWRRRLYTGSYGFPPAFEEWHRRAHEKMTTEPDAAASGRS
jgi:hypothetical protein